MPKIDLDDVVEAALTVGLDGLSMRAVARHLGVGASTLYYHVESLEELRQLASERLLERFDPGLADPADWERVLERGARALLQVFEQASGLAETALHEPVWGDTITALNERACAFLVSAGFSPEHAWLALRAVVDIVEAHAVRQSAHQQAGRTDLDNVDETGVETPTLRAARASLGRRAAQRRLDVALRSAIAGLRELVQ